MMKLRVSDFARTLDEVKNHLRLAIECADRIIAEARQLSDRDLIAAAREVAYSDDVMKPAVSMVCELYRDELCRRGLNMFPTAANGDDDAPF